MLNFGSDGLLRFLCFMSLKRYYNVLLYIFDDNFLPNQQVCYKAMLTWALELLGVTRIQYQPWIKHWGHNNRGNDHQLKKLLNVKQILPVSTTGNVWRTVWRICMLMLGCSCLRLTSIKQISNCTQKKNPTLFFHPLPGDSHEC